MLRCSPEAFAKCPTRALCCSPQEATFAEGSECDQFNRSVIDSPLTNADAIRCMSDDDLAEFLFAVQINALVLCGVTPPAHIQPPILWLMQPMEVPNFWSNNEDRKDFFSKRLAVPAASVRSCYECAYCLRGKYIKGEQFCLHPARPPGGLPDDNCFVKRGSKGDV